MNTIGVHGWGATVGSGERLSRIADPLPLLVFVEWAAALPPALLRKAGLNTIALVACQAISPESMVFAAGRQVRVWCNGRLVESAA